MDEAKVFLKLVEAAIHELQRFENKTAKPAERNERQRWLLKRLKEDRRDTLHAIRRMRAENEEGCAVFINPPAFCHVLSALALLTRS